jgi:hypothetical protein
MGNDICVLSQTEFLSAKGGKITLGVQCRDVCDFKLDVGTASEYTLEDGKEMESYYEPNQERIYKFFVPANPNITYI